MHDRRQLGRLVSASAAAAMTIAAVCAVAAPRASAQEAASYRNATAGGPLRHGVYGRIEVRGSVPPAVVYPHPVVAARPGWPVPPRATPVYLYVPSGQVRRWAQHCARWKACDEPVLFVRMQDGPGRWGEWRLLREQVAVQDRAP